MILIYTSAIPVRQARTSTFVLVVPLARTHLLTTFMASDSVIWLGTEESTNLLDPIATNFDPAHSSSEHQLPFPDPGRNDASSQPPPLSNHIPPPLVDGPRASTRPMPPTTAPDHRTEISSSPIVAEQTPSTPGLLNALRKVMPDVSLEKNLVKLQERCTKKGGDPAAIALIPSTFAKGITKEALKRRKPKRGAPPSMTDGYLKFVGRGSVTTTNEQTVPVYWCLLCPSGQRLAYKDVKNVLPHLCSKHFGLSSRGKSNGERVLVYIFMVHRIRLYTPSLLD